MFRTTMAPLLMDAGALEVSLYSFCYKCLGDFDVDIYQVTTWLVPAIQTVVASGRMIGGTNTSRGAAMARPARAKRPARNFIS